MLRGLLRFCALALCCSVLAGCIYSKVTLPLDTDVNQTKLGSKVGRASAQSVLWLVAWGDGGVEAAAKDGGLQVINQLDVEQKLIFFGVYSQVTTIAYGD